MAPDTGILIVAAILTGASVMVRLMGDNRSAWLASVFAAAVAATTLRYLQWLGITNVVESAYALAGLAIAVALPRLKEYREETSLLLALEAAGLIVLGTSDARVALIGFVAPLLILHRRSRAFITYEALGALAFVVGIVLTGLQQSLSAGLCYLAAAMIRQGVFPFQSGLFALSRDRQDGGLQTALLAPTGIAVFLKFAMPQIQAGTSNTAALVAVLAAGAVYLGLLCLVQEQMSRLAMLAPAVIASLIMAAGAGGAEPYHLELPWLLLTIGCCGLALVARLARARTEDGAIPTLAGFYLIFVVAMGGLPGTLGAIAEETLEQSLLEVSWIDLCAGLFAIAFLSVGLYKAYVRLYLGRTLPVEVSNISLRERLGLFTLILALIGLGFIH